MGQFFRRRGRVFVDGKPLEPVEQMRELVSANWPGPPPPNAPKVLNDLPQRIRTAPIMQEIGGTPDGGSRGQFGYRNLYSSAARNAREPRNRSHNSRTGVCSIAKGAVIHSSVIPIPQRRFVSTSGGNHWIIEDNTIEWANGTGLDIGNGDWGGPGTPQAGLNQITPQYYSLLRRGSDRHGHEGYSH